ncbi:MAG: DUF3592 domain-containing protein [Clostridiales bacterium]|nr:DUF3592 domain-containing protein [Clostridiales bacterium]
MFRIRDYYHPMWIVALVLYIGLILLGHGTYDYINGDKMADICSSVATGVVVNSEKHTIIEYETRYIAYVATVEPKDSSIFSSSRLRSTETDYAYQNGETVLIHYDPSDPSTYYIQYAEPTAGNLTQVVIGAVLIFLGLGFFAMYKKIK